MRIPPVGALVAARSSTVLAQAYRRTVATRLVGGSFFFALSFVYVSHRNCLDCSMTIYDPYLMSSPLTLKAALERRGNFCRASLELHLLSKRLFRAILTSTSGTPNDQAAICFRSWDVVEKAEQEIETICLEESRREEEGEGRRTNGEALDSLSSHPRSSECEMT